MWIVWTVSFASIAVLFACILLIRQEIRTAHWPWRILAGSGIPLAIGGLGFILRFWEPQRGPYLANVLYPLGPYLNAWAVSFGFMWLSFGLAFLALTLMAPHDGRLWTILFTAWVLAWIPHGIIGIGFAWAGSNEPSVALYRDWGSTKHGLLRLVSGVLILFTHFTFAIGGFILTARDVWWRRSERVLSA